MLIWLPPKRGFLYWALIYFLDNKDVLHVTSFDTKEMKALLDKLCAEAGDATKTHHLLINNGKNGQSGDHWTRAKVVIEPTSKQITINHVDSIGTGDVDVKTLFASKLPDDFALEETNSTAIKTGEQTDGWSCGYRAFYGALDEMAREGDDTLQDKAKLQKYLQDANIVAEDESKWAARTKDTAVLPESDNQQEAMFNLVLGPKWQEPLAVRAKEKKRQEEEAVRLARQQEQKKTVAEQKAKATLGNSIFAASAPLAEKQLQALTTFAGGKDKVKKSALSQNVMCLTLQLGYERPKAEASQGKEQVRFEAQIEVSAHGAQIPARMKLPRDPEALKVMAEKLVHAYVISAGGSFTPDGKVQDPTAVPEVELQAKDEALHNAIVERLNELHLTHNAEVTHASLSRATK